MPATHTDKAFEQDLRDLREKLLAMGAQGGDPDRRQHARAHRARHARWPSR